MVFLEKMREGHCQSDERQKYSKGNVGKTSLRWGGAHMGFSERIDTILNWTEGFSVYSAKTTYTFTATPLQQVFGVSTWKVMWKAWSVAFLSLFSKDNIHLYSKSLVSVPGRWCGRPDLLGTGTVAADPSPRGCFVACLRKSHRTVNSDPTWVFKADLCTSLPSFIFVLEVCALQIFHY